MPMYKVPVRCPECSKTTFVISPGDKVYCLNKDCNYGFRLTSIVENQEVDEQNKRMMNYYVRQLEEQVLLYRNVDPQKFRLEEDDGQPKLIGFLEKTTPYSDIKVVGPPDPDYSCGADFCDDPACVTHFKEK